MVISLQLMTTMKVGNFTRYGLLERMAGVPKLRNAPCATFVLGYSCPVQETCYHGNFRTVSAGNFYTAMRLGKPTQFDMLEMTNVLPQLRNIPCAISRCKTFLSGPQILLSW